ncbi:DUF1896 domain-containing protein [Bacteroides neonati]|uniref:DUF1896 domain-containing protein n=1 Tax=Bacteroides neonati TaxID=1347393 RepID=UPI0004B75069|nr:DUF1896 domain-containing protein [Bacteroides neonati]
MNQNNEPMELSYYGLSLLSFLKESHPDKLNDTAFIEARANLAADTYENALREGYVQSGAEEMANDVLYTGLHFSCHDAIVNVLWNEFADEVPQGDAREVAIRLLPHLKVVFDKYPLSDDFAYTLEYELLYTELTGAILIHFEEYGI